MLKAGGGSRAGCPMDGHVTIAVRYFCIQMLSTYLVPGTELYKHPPVIPQPLEAAAITPIYTRGNGGLVRLRNSAGGQYS